jgi:hypothetical protein
VHVGVEEHEPWRVAALSSPVAGKVRGLHRAGPDDPHTAVALAVTRAPPVVGDGQGVPGLRDERGQPRGDRVQRSIRPLERQHDIDSGPRRHAAQSTAHPAVLAYLPSRLGA